jgi:23S rRNA maturation-related 3'-5' exoribonuclease YhaM
LFETHEQRILKLAKKLLKELDKAGYNYRNKDIGHIDIWTGLSSSTLLMVGNVINDWEIKEGSNCSQLR